ncbi:hypothetical protein CHARACLAT_021390 [Characodon lateralis]|uniref:Uncharacterized protein n=1 Tax=Characodon lateralis TaxID=208331 RepID=A0ABU7E2P2_9TELE|nr:hypothetical protein [Characodon lateralis]
MSMKPSERRSTLPAVLMEKFQSPTKFSITQGIRRAAPVSGQQSLGDPSPLVLSHDVCLDGLDWTSNFPSGINKVSLNFSLSL